jgi:hypothetical protein
VGKIGGWAIALVLSASAVAHAQQQFGDPANPNTYITQRTSPPFPIPVTTQTIDVTYYVDPGEFTATEHSLINQAAAIWSRAGGASVRLVEVFAPGAQIEFTQPNLNNNTTNLADRQVTSTPGLGTYPDGRPWRQITNADIQIDRNLPATNPWYFNVGTFLPNEHDYLTVLIREFGFGLGLGFAGAGDPNSVMDNNIQPGEMRRNLSTGDIAALQTLYGTPEPATWALFGVGLLTMGAAYRLRRR